MALSYLLRYIVSPSALIIGTPLFIVLCNYIIQDLNGNMFTLYDAIKSNGLYSFIIEQCLLKNLPTTTHFAMVFAFYAIQILLYYMLPGKKAHGPPTMSGYVPEYKENGVVAYCVNIIMVLIGYFIFKLPLHQLINEITPLIIAICIISWIIVFILMACALCCPQNPSDVKSSGNPIMDYYSGLELYPYWFGINCKQLINCRIGMTQWALICLCYILKDFDNMKQLSNIDGYDLLFYVLCSPVFISGALQIIYLFKFFWWEIGYFGTLDVMHDRCGWMICWGCLSWVFSVYTFHTGVILSNKLYKSNLNNDAFDSNLNGLVAGLIFIVGILSIYVNYEADAQKIRVRKANGNCKIFGKKADIIRATYVTDKGKNKKSILLVSGYWGIARHFHYIPELMFALMICVPGVTVGTSIQLFYFIFLVLLLTDRAGRDDVRCSKKYRKFWKQYRKRVPYKLIPYVW